jgi:hypothetical protein
MRILLLSQFYPPVIGGEERHVRNLGAGAARERGERRDIDASPISGNRDGRRGPRASPARHPPRMSAAAGGPATAAAPFFGNQEGRVATTSVETPNFRNGVLSIRGISRRYAAITPAGSHR